MKRKIKINRRLTFTINPDKTNYFPEGGKGNLINKRGKKIPYKVLNCSDGEGEIMVPRIFFRKMRA